MRYAFIERHRKTWPITVQCHVLNVSVSGYHEHVARRASSAPRRHLSDQVLLVHVKAIHAQCEVIGDSAIMVILGRQVGLIAESRWRGFGSA